MAKVLDYPTVWQVTLVQDDGDEDGLIDIAHLIEVGIQNSDYLGRVAIYDYDLQDSGRNVY